MLGWIRRFPVAAFVVCAYALSWAWWIPLALGPDPAAPGVGWPTHLPGLLGPAIAALAVLWVTGGPAAVGDLVRRSLRWRVDPRWWVLVGATFALAIAALAAPGTATADMWRYSGLPEWGPLTVLVVVLVVNGWGEEAGWRGFLADRLLPEHGLTGTAVRVWIVWAIWHVPLFWLVASFQSFNALFLAGWLSGMLAGSVVLTWIYRGSGRSILLVAAWHTAFNATSATVATADLVAPISSALVMVAAVVLVVRAGRTG